jgi:hypothetical protein
MSNDNDDDLVWNFGNASDDDDVESHDGFTHEEYQACLKVLAFTHSHVSCLIITHQ